MAVTLGGPRGTEAGPTGVLWCGLVTYGPVPRVGFVSVCGTRRTLRTHQRAPAVPDGFPRVDVGAGVCSVRTKGGGAGKTQVQ